jgi:hypothetical protein
MTSILWDESPIVLNYSICLYYILTYSVAWASEDSYRAFSVIQYSSVPNVLCVSHEEMGDETSKLSSKKDYRFGI